MANNPAVNGRYERQSPSTTATLWTMVLGWVLVRLVATGGHRRAVRSADAGRGVGSPTAGRHGERGVTGRPGGGKQHAPPDALHEKGRGRHAETPTAIPAKGWKDVMWRTWDQIGKDRIMAVAAGVTFYALLALFPAIAALVSIYGLFLDPTTIETHLNTLSGILPGGAMEIIGEQVRRIAEQGSGALGFGFIAGLLISLWSANAGMKAIFDALNVVYDEEEKRSFVALNLRSLAFTIGAIIFLLLSVAGIVVVPIILGYIGLGSSTEWLLSLARWPVLLIVVVAGLALLFRYGPSRDTAEWKWVTPGGLFAAVVWLGGSLLFSWYVANFGNYNETYGSLGAVIGFMTWIWLSTIVVLVGAEINAELEHQTAKDTTEGKSEPLGSRGAEMADTLGQARA